nr:PREDICTED: vegetative cell wall protein gp1-like [Struthio camelus australis]
MHPGIPAPHSPASPPGAPLGSWPCGPWDPSSMRPGILAPHPPGSPRYAPRIPALHPLHPCSETPGS